jgi:hypothetical protein
MDDKTFYGICKDIWHHSLTLARSPAEAAVIVNWGFEVEKRLKALEVPEVPKDAD